jgi:cytochrome c biogenesis protein
MSGIGWIVDRFSSIRFTIAICILLAAVSLLGTLVPQNANPQDYTRMYGEVLGPLVSKLGIADIYHSAGFIFLLCLLAANLVACTGKRFPAVWRSLRREISVPSDTEFKSWRNRDAFALENTGRAGDWDAAGLAVKLSGALGKTGRETVLPSGGRLFLFERNRISRVGPYLAHVSSLLILAGALVGAWFGFKGTLILPEGGTEDSIWLSQGHEQLALGFQIRCNRFVIDLYPNGAPREYRSEVSILDEEGDLIRDAVIRVNHPLTFQGITFYQSTYGDLSTVVLDVKDRESGQQAQVETEVRIPFPLPGESGDRAWIMNVRENMKIPPQMVEMTRFKQENLGPGVQVRIFSKGQGFGDPFWVLKDFPELEESREGKYRFTFNTVQSTAYTGLQVAHDPGTPLVWTGCILLIVGFILSFLLDHEVLWVAAEPGEDNRVEVRVAGRATRHPAGYAARFDKRKAAIRNALGLS